MEFRVSVGLAALCVALATAGNVRDIIPPETSECQCEEIQSSLCATHFGTQTWFGRFPNARNLDKSGSIAEFFHFYPLLLLNNYCSHVLYNLLCFHYFPKCSPERPGLGATPCRETCNEAIAACYDHVRARSPNYVFPEHLNCSNFHSGESNCGGGSVTGEDGSGCEETCTACPNATIHLEFATEPGARVLRGSEFSGRADICLRLANTGSYNTSDALGEEVVVNLSSMTASGSLLYRLVDTNTRLSTSPAEAGLDFFENTVTITFPVGSRKGDVRCRAVEIIFDYEEEGIEIFAVNADILSPSSAIFGRALQSSSGVIAVLIDDNWPVATPTETLEVTSTSVVLPTSALEKTSSAPMVTKTSLPSPSPLPSLEPVADPIMPGSECKTNCNWRTKITGNVFRNARNIYSYVAHIRVLGCRGPVLKVDIVECQNIICGVCPPRGYYKIAHCSDCLQDCPVNEEFVVAGGKSGDSLYISNYKRGGLFAIQQRYGNWATFVPSQCTDN